MKFITSWILLFNLSIISLIKFLAFFISLSKVLLSINIFIVSNIGIYSFIASSEISFILLEKFWILFIILFISIFLFIVCIIFILPNLSFINLCANSSNFLFILLCKLFNVFFIFSKSVFKLAFNSLEES